MNRMDTGAGTSLLTDSPTETRWETVSSITFLNRFFWDLSSRLHSSWVKLTATSLMSSSLKKLWMFWFRQSSPIAVQSGRLS